VALELRHQERVAGVLGQRQKNSGCWLAEDQAQDERHPIEGAVQQVDVVGVCGVAVALGDVLFDRLPDDLEARSLRVGPYSTVGYVGQVMPYPLPDVFRKDIGVQKTGAEGGRDSLTEEGYGRLSQKLWVSVVERVESWERESDTFFLHLPQLGGFVKNRATDEVRGFRDVGSQVFHRQGPGPHRLLLDLLGNI